MLELDERYRNYVQEIIINDYTKLNTQLITSKKKNFLVSAVRNSGSKIWSIKLLKLLHCQNHAFRVTILHLILIFCLLLMAV